MTKATRRKVVLGLWVCGRQIKEMADDIGVPKNVIEWDRQTLLRQHGARNAPELIRKVWTPRNPPKV